MSAAIKEAIDLMEILPESDQNFALEFIKKLVLAWNPDYTKVTSEEKSLRRSRKRHYGEWYCFPWCYRLGLSGGKAYK